MQTTAEEVAASVRAGETLLISGGGEFLLPDELLEALERRFLETGEPRDLTLVYNVFPGGSRPGTGIERLVHPGLVRRVYAGSYYSLRATGLTDLVKRNAIEAYLVPYGHLYAAFRAAAADQPGVLTRVGLGSFLDPRNGGGRLTDRTTEPFQRIVTVADEEVIFVPALHIDVAFLRGTTADELGNIGVEEEPVLGGLLSLAMATRGSGGRVHVQVKRLAAAAALHPRRVAIPGVFVDSVSHAPMQDAYFPYDPALTGDLRVPRVARAAKRFDHPELILRRAALELRPGTLVNVGMGLPASLPALAAEEGVADRLWFNTEHGPVGGVPNDRESFGPGVNMSMTMDPPDIFAMFAGGALDATFLGLGEVEGDGSVNVSEIDGRHNLGGFVDIVHATPRIVFCGTFMGGGLKTSVADGRLRIDREGTSRKFVTRVAQRSLDGPRARSRGQRVTYVTERAVFELGEHGLELTEIAEGVDLERDVLAHMDVRPVVSPQLRRMPPEVLAGGPLGLSGNDWFGKGNR